MTCCEVADKIIPVSGTLLPHVQIILLIPNKGSRDRATGGIQWGFNFS